MLTKVGSEYRLKNNLSGVSVTVGLFNDSTDGIVEQDDLAQITTEPSDGNYARQSTTITLVEDTNKWMAQIADALSFDVTNTTGNVDSFFVVINFQAAGDGSATDHLFFVSAINEGSIDLSSIPSLDVAAGTISLRG